MSRPQSEGAHSSGLGARARSGVGHEPARDARAHEEAGLLRWGALAGALALTASYVWVLRSITDVVGGTGALVLVVIVSLFSGVTLARLCSTRAALAIGFVITIGGIGVYVAAVPEGLVLLASVGSLARDSLALLTGLSVLRMVEAGTWAIAFGPAPVFLSWYLVCRRRYTAGTSVGLLALSVLVLTGDASLLTATIGVLGAASVIGFGELERREASVGQSDALAIALSLMLVATLSVTMVPGGASQPLMPEGQTQALDGALVGADEQVTIVGAIELSPEVRFTVESDEPAYWRTDAYDRYTGSTWVQSGEPQAYEGERAGPPGESETISQTVEAETELAAMPAAWQPVSIDGPAADGAQVTAHDGFQPSDPLEAGERYTVESERPDPSTEELRAAGTDYPEGIEDDYTQLPGSTPDRVGEYTESLTAEAETPYEQAQITEQHLSSQWGYTLDVERPDGDIADATLFEMDAAYCTYFATTMVAMLRSQEVPARMAVGYTEGEEIDEDRYAVRGLDAHAWVEVYFPEVGWIEFDPTPPDRDAIHENRLDDAREDDEPGVDTADTERAQEERNEETDETDESEESINGTDDESETEDDPSGGEAAPGSAQPFADRAESGADSDDDPVSSQPGSETERLADIEGDESSGTDLSLSRELFIALGALVVGLVAGAHRIGGIGRLAGLVDRKERKQTPKAATERAYERLEGILESTYRTRRSGESVRQYIDALSLVGVDERAKRVAALYEKARYGPGVSEAEAEEALALVAELHRERSLRERLGRD